MVRTVIAAALVDRGYEVTEAADGASALELVRDGLELDALVTDLAMPGDLDGLALIREVRQCQPGLPALLLTGHVGDAGDAALQHAARSGPFVMLHKPVTAEVLEARLAALLAA